MKKEPVEIEEKKLIAERQPPGDRWMLVDDKDEVIHDSLTDAIEAYFVANKYKGDYRMNPIDGELYVFELVEKKPEPKVHKKLNIYGEAV